MQAMLECEDDISVDYAATSLRAHSRGASFKDPFNKHSNPAFEKDSSRQSLTR